MARKDQSRSVHRRHQTVCRNEKRNGSIITGSETIQSGHMDGIWHRKMRHVNNEKQETTNDGSNRATKARMKSEH